MTFRDDLPYIALLAVVAAIPGLLLAQLIIDICK